MSDTNAKGNCALMSWGMAALAGFLAFVLLLALGDWRVIQAIFAGLVICVLLGALLSWLLCRPLPAPRESAPVAKAASAAPAGPGPSAGATPRPTASATPAPTPTAATAPAPAPAADAPPPEPAPQATPAPAPEPAPPEPAPEPAPASRAEAEETPGEKPQLLDSAPADGGDDLKRIKGIGPKLEQVCNDLGIYTFSQIANWSDAEVAWVDSNLEGFKGRVQRDNWVEQARVLAAGGASGS